MSSRCYERGPAVKVAQRPRNGFRSVTLPLKDGFEYSVRLG